MFFSTKSDMLYTETDEHRHEAEAFGAYRDSFEPGLQQVLWLTCKHGRPFDYELPVAGSIHLPTHRQCDVLLYMRATDESVEVHARVHPDYKRPTLPDRLICRVEPGARMELNIPVWAITHDQLVVTPARANVTCGARVLPVNYSDNADSAASADSADPADSSGPSFEADGRSFTVRGGFVWPRDWVGGSGGSFYGLCQCYRPPKMTAR